MHYSNSVLNIKYVNYIVSNTNKKIWLEYYLFVDGLLTICFIRFIVLYAVFISS